ncbi:MAG TPA: PASTA domain-containing protein [Gaiellaceae bacterium]|nr:PASTA domain-containing protein [Gaiellaceae bacterium]
MALRLSTILPRIFVLAVVALLTTATFTFAASTRGGPAVNTPVAATAKPILLVPDVRGQAYVFAKSTLEEGGFAWRVTGAVQGYAANLVASQSPPPGSRVYDTGAPTITLGLDANTRYPQVGSPENVSSFSGTVIQRVGVVTKAKSEPKAKTKVKPKVKPKPKPKPKRPPAFVVAGAKPEPLDEIPLTARARRLDRWLSSNRSLTDPNVSYWLYQHAWIVTGAKFGWWHGAQALDRLIQVDQRVQRVWGIGSRSERVARVALAEVRSKSR